MDSTYVGDFNRTCSCYNNGFGVEKNEGKAFEMYLKSADDCRINTIFVVWYKCEYRLKRSKHLNGIRRQEFFMQMVMGQVKAFEWFNKAEKK
ncbi:hypothetical protein Glove_334g30 [Diversispora epigaea]|uniref:Uncharacterized protein n=1 Tax=Diversispora epigaea TaxID=1348612 RepID=A0A397HIS4_9GLOM|nr:hypothetical protein Glove_334g30 [Diversispora epigaea]